MLAKRRNLSERVILNISITFRGLDPLFFLIYMKDLLKLMNLYSKAIHFSDDTIVLIKKQ